MGKRQEGKAGVQRPLGRAAGILAPSQIQTRHGSFPFPEVKLNPCEVSSVTGTITYQRQALRFLLVGHT